MMCTSTFYLVAFLFLFDVENVFFLYPWAASVESTSGDWLLVNDRFSL